MTNMLHGAWSGWQLRAVDRKSRLTNHESRITTHEPRLTNHESRLTTHAFKFPGTALITRTGQ
jgi:hypothetical protein